MLTDHCEKLKKYLGGASQIGKATFALLCTERLQTCCWAFQCKFEFDLQFFTKTIFAIAESLKAGELGKDFADVRQLIHTHFPSPEDFPSPLAAQTRFALLALESTIQVFKTGNLASCLEAATHVIDSVDNYEYFAWSEENMASPFKSNDQNWLLQTELERQIRQAHKVIEISRESLNNLRVENRFFAIPPAVE